jgi:hypothetical protein
MKPEEILNDPILMLKEAEAYFTFRLMGDNPFIPKEDMQMMKNDFAECLRRNGHEVNYRKQI